MCIRDSGDGDHGTAIVAAMTAVNKSAQSGTEFKQMLGDMGMDVMMEVSGSTSTLLGAFFLGMSDHAEGTELDAAGVKVMFAGGLANVQQQTQAKRGDKTMMDALILSIRRQRQMCIRDRCSLLLQRCYKIIHSVRRGMPRLYKI